MTQSSFWSQTAARFKAENVKIGGVSVVRRVVTNSHSVFLLHEDKYNKDVQMGAKSTSVCMF